MELIEQIEEERVGRSVPWVCAFMKSHGHVNPFLTLSAMWRAGYLVIADHDGRPLPRWRCEEILRNREENDGAMLLATDRGSEWVHGPAVQAGRWSTHALRATFTYQHGTWLSWHEIEMPFIRFVIAKQHPDSGVKAGLFDVAYTLCDDADVNGGHREELRELLAWFEKHLSTPVRFNRTKSKGYYRRAARGIAWFRDSATECIRRMHRLKTLLEANGYMVAVIHADRVGYVVYEDDSQVVAEPFADTPTGV